MALAMKSWLGLAALLTVGAAQAAASDPSLKAFLGKFADMASHGAVASMAKVTRFPLKNEVYQQPGAISPSGFKHHFQLNGYPTLAACLKATPPQRATNRSADLGEWEVDCDGNIFHFARDGDAWRHSGFENVNE